MTPKQFWMVVLAVYIAMLAGHLTFPMLIMLSQMLHAGMGG